MNIIIAGGGTGGHLYPGIAVAEEFEGRPLDGGVKIQKDNIVFAGTEHGIEAKVIPREGYPIRFLRAEGLVGKSILKKAKASFLFLLSIRDSLKIIRSIKPDIVIGVGGYASVGMVLAAHFKGIPTMILEQNSVPGSANRFLSKFVDAIAVTYQESTDFFPHYKTYLTGNPVRKGMLATDKEKAYSIFPIEKDRFTIFVFGGSSGARSINYFIVEALRHLTDLRKNIQFLHQTGQRDYDEVREAYLRLGFSGVVTPYIYQMAEAYAISDIVVSRAGATTLSEITITGKPSILIPYPYAAANHQEYNARKLEDMGAARLILEKDLNGEKLASSIRELYENKEMRIEMQKAALAFGRTDAAEKIVDLAMSLIKK